MDQDCQKSLPHIFCHIGNAAGIVSTCFWFLVLLPQVIRNYQRKSVRGLNLLWALLNFTASLCNVLFMFRITVPVQTRVMAVYMPVLEFIMLLQFFFWYENTNENNNYNDTQKDDATTTTNTINERYSSSRRKKHSDDDNDDDEDADNNSNNNTNNSHNKNYHRFIVCFLCVIIWLTVILVQVFHYESSSYIAWIAIVLWSIETFPQLYTNISTPTNAVQGQSFISILITCCGKTTDALSAYFLEMPTQTRVLAYYSGTSAWINALYVLVLYINRGGTKSSQDLSVIDGDNDENNNNNSAVNNNTDATVNARTTTAATTTIISSEQQHGEKEKDTRKSREEEEEKRKLLQQGENNEGVSSSFCFSMTNQVETTIRNAFSFSSVVRFGFGLILVCLMVSVIVACVLTIHPTYVVVFLPLSTISVLGIFHWYLSNG